MLEESWKFRVCFGFIYVYNSILWHGMLGFICLISFLYWERAKQLISVPLLCSCSLYFNISNPFRFTLHRQCWLGWPVIWYSFSQSNFSNISCPPNRPPKSDALNFCSANSLFTQIVVFYLDSPEMCFYCISIFGFVRNSIQNYKSNSVETSPL